MATCYYYVGGTVSGGKYIWLLKDDGTTISLIDSFVGPSATVVSMAVSPSGKIYVAAGNYVYCYNSDFTALATWGTTGSINIGGVVSGIQVDGEDYLIVAHAVVNTDKRFSFYNNLGVRIWQYNSGTNTIGGCCDFDTAGNIVGSTIGGSAGQTAAALLSRSSGTVLEEYGTKVAAGANSYTICASKTTANTAYWIQSYTTSTIACNNLTTQVWTKTYTGTAGRHLAHLSASGYIILTDGNYLRRYDDDDGANLTSSASLGTEVGNVIINSSNDIVCSYTNTLAVFNSSLVSQRTLVIGATLNTIVQVGSIPVDKHYTKKLVAASGNAVYYESESGTMSLLSTTLTYLNTSQPLSMCGSFQKEFIANNSNLKVVDFGNTKLTTSTLSATNPPDYGNVLTGGTSGAQMIVDYCSTLTGTAEVYGRKVTSASFISTDTVTGLDDDTHAISFTLTAPQTDPPNFYTWTTYGNVSTNGTMPSSAYLVCRYRARLVLAGHPNYPHQWYMSKVGNPWDWLYGTDDPLSAVAGNNADAGEVGDIIRALIPYGDDFLIFGCSTSMWLLDGDPVSGGSLDQISDTTGIFGANSWCKDSSNNLYFWGSGGLYKMENGRTRPTNIGLITNPQWVSAWATEPSTHRVVLAYDPFRDGIIITRITLNDGTNLSYWYDLKTQGLYPESVPASCGFYSSIYYDADDKDYRATVYGCTDGYLRSFLDTAKSDDSGTTNTEINAYVTIAPFPIGDGVDNEGKISQIVLESGGGASGGDSSDTDGFTYDVFVADDAETCVEDVIDAATANLTGTISGTGRKTRIRQNIRGMYGTIKITNSTISQTFAINRILVDRNIVGRLK